MKTSTIGVSHLDVNLGHDHRLLAAAGIQSLTGLPYPTSAGESHAPRRKLWASKK